MKKLEKLELIDKLEEYERKNLGDAYLVREMSKFILDSSDPFDRNNVNGHITAGGLVVCGTYVLLNKHRKLNKLISFGGHANLEEQDPYLIALREIQEETGITNVRSSAEIFDISKFTFMHDDVLPEHVHYDIRYLFFAKKKMEFSVSEESSYIIWRPLDVAINEVKDIATKRMLLKYREILNEENDCIITQK